jgi:hypothetical protein
LGFGQTDLQHTGFRIGNQLLPEVDPFLAVNVVYRPVLVLRVVTGARCF